MPSESFCLVLSGDTGCRISRERDMLAEIYLGPWTFDKLDFMELALLGSVSAQKQEELLGVRHAEY